MDENKSSKSVITIISLFVAVLALIGSSFAITFSLLSNNQNTSSEPIFNISKMKIDKEVSRYDSEYVTDTVSYKGEATITTNEINRSYIVLVKITLVSGGSPESEKEEIRTTTVVDGFGEIGTYDYDDIGEIVEPAYEFTIIGYTELNTLGTTE